MQNRSYAEVSFSDSANASTMTGSGHLALVRLDVGLNDLRSKSSGKYELACLSSHEN